jgi:hypothetical protein
MFWVDGVTLGVHVWNGTTYSQITSGLSTTLAPVDIGIWENRLFVVYETGNVLFSRVGDPTNFDASTGHAGEIDIGEPITNTVAAAGLLVFFTRQFIKILHYGSTTDQFIFKLDDFSTSQGALDYTAQNLFETIYFSDDRGGGRLVPDERTGSFLLENIGEKVETEYLNNKDNITGSTIDITKRRYFIFYTSGSTSNGLIYTMNKGRVKGVGRMELDHKATVVAHGVQNDGTNRILFGDDSGMVYLMESGTSFDGNAIDTSFTSSHHHYGSPRHWKNFLRLGFEIDCGSELPITVGVQYDYGSPLLADPGSGESYDVSGGSSTWGGGIVWGSFTWGAGVLGRGIAYIHGYGTNMAVVFTTSTAVFDQHTVHNVTTDYVQGGIRQ